MIDEQLKTEQFRLGILYVCEELQRHLTIVIKEIETRPEPDQSFIREFKTVWAVHQFVEMIASANHRAIRFNKPSASDQ